MGTLPPSEYKLSCGYHYFSGFRSGANPKWTVPTVNTILTNEMYTGTMVQGYYQKVSYKVNRYRTIPKDEWIRVPGTHEAIVSKTMLEDAKSVHPVKVSMFDRNKYLFNCANDTLDLSTLEFRPHNPEDFITRVSPIIYAPDATCPRWNRFVDEVRKAAVCRPIELQGLPKRQPLFAF